MSDISKMTVHSALRALNNKECSSVELVKQLLQRIRDVDDEIGAYTFIDEERVLKDAEEADRKRMASESGKLLGVPIAVKDNLSVKGQPCTCGSKILAGYIAPFDATAVSKLKAEGAVILGRTNMDEFAMGSSTENSAIKLTRNPVAKDHVPGGSSGGSAAAVASGEAIAALGSDTGGSIRQPSTFCGCVGLKPSYGRVSRYGLVAFASSLDQIGPITKDVTDSALLLEVISGVDSYDSTSVNMPVPNYTALLEDNLNGFVLGVPKQYFEHGMDKEVENRVRQAIETCGKLGADIIEVDLPHTEYAVAVYYIICTAEASTNLARFDGVRYGFRDYHSKDVDDMYCQTRAKGFGAEVKRRIMLGTYVLSSGYYDAYYLTATKVRTLIRCDFEKAFEKCDALLAPVTPTPPYKIGEKINDPLSMYLGDIFTVMANLAGVCAISIPCGYTTDKLPVGFQILGPAFKEENILRVSFAYEQYVKQR